MRRGRQALALGLFGLALALSGYGLVSVAWPGSEQIPNRPSFVDFLLFLTIFMTFPTVGLVVAWERPRHPVGWLFLGVGLGITMAIFAVEYAGRVAYAGADLPGAPYVAWLGGWIWGLAVGLALPLAIILFPDGRLPSPGWRLPVGLGVGAMAAAIVAIAIDPRPLQGFDGRIPNPFAVGGPIGELAVALTGPSTLAVLMVLQGLAISALVARFRRSRGADRQQLKWLLYPMGVMVIGLAIGIPTTISAAWSAALVGLAGIPVGVGIAILRHRLFDIDLVIRRTLVYGALVAVLGAAYVGLVLGLQTVLSNVTGGDTLPVALSTLAIAALFGPVRTRVRQLVDRRFFRSRYDAQRTLEQFAGQLRDQVELDAVAGRLVAVAAGAVAPRSASVWIRQPNVGP